MGLFSLLRGRVGRRKGKGCFLFLLLKECIYRMESERGKCRRKYLPKRTKIAKTNDLNIFLYVLELLCCCFVATTIILLLAGIVVAVAGGDDDNVCVVFVVDEQS